MRVWISRPLIVGLIWLLSPGLTETAENLWHLVSTGHSAHSIEEGPDHAPQGDEHGCTGTFHFCGCHHSSPTTLPMSLAGAELQPADRLFKARIRHFQSPILPGLLRPPQV